MSTRGSLFLTVDGDHWYEDFSTLSKSSTPEGKHVPNIYISIGKKDVIDFEYCKDQETYFFEIDGDTPLARAISKCRNGSSELSE